MSLLVIAFFLLARLTDSKFLGYAFIILCAGIAVKYGIDIVNAYAEAVSASQKGRHTK